jgi:hypothetical protein
MTFEEIRIAVESRVAAWPDAPVAFDGVPNSPALQSAIDNKDSWVRLTINHGDSFTACIGDGPKVRRTGLIQCQVFTKLDRGSRPAALLADSLAAQLEYWQSGKLETQAASVQRVGPDDGWYMYLLSVPFRAD